MVNAAIKEQILSELERLSPELQRRALALVHSLATSTPKGASVEDLLEITGTLDRESAREMREAIEQNCERVDPNEW